MNQLKERVLAAVAEEPSRPHRAAARHRWLLLAGAGLASLAIFALAGGIRPTGRPVALWIATSTGAIAIAGVAVALAFRRGSSMLGRPASVLLGLALVTPLVLLAWKLGVSSLFPEMTRWWPERPGLRCLYLATSTGLAPTAAMLYLGRGTAPAHPRLTGLALGTAAGALVWVLVDFWCPVAHLRHLLLGHVLPLVLLAALGVAAGGLLAARRMPRRRSAA